MSDIRELNRMTTGVKLINMDIEHDVTVASIAKVRQKSAEESESLEALEKEMNENDNAEGAPELDENVEVEGDPEEETK